MTAQKFVVTLCRRMPALVLDKGIVGAQVQGHRLAADGTGRDQRGRDLHALLFVEHPIDDLFVIIGLLMAGHGALEESVIALCIEQAVFVEACFPETMVDVRRQDKVVLVLNQGKEPLIGVLRRIGIAVDMDKAAPVRPHFLGRELHRDKAAGVHILDAVDRGEVGKVSVEPLSGIDESRRGGQSRSRAEDHRVRGSDFFFE